MVASKKSILGSHMSIAGGYYRAVDAAADAGCDCVQVFTKNNNQWRAKPITDDDVDKFRTAMAEKNISHPISHASYLINLASPKSDLCQKSIDAMIVELQRADQLGIPYVVVHPGSFTTSSQPEGLDRIVASLNAVHQKTEGLSSECLLENTAGQGSNLGWQFEHLSYVIENVEQPERVGVCIDTCHAFAAGYAMDTEEAYKATVSQLRKTVGLKKVKAFHLNDSKKPFGSRRDRHEHIGEGEMGLEPFRFLLNDSRFKKTPMYLETAKGTNDAGEDFDVANLRVLRSLIE